MFGMSPQENLDILLAAIVLLGIGFLSEGMELWGYILAACAAIYISFAFIL